MHSLLELKSLNHLRGMFRLFLLLSLALAGCAINSGSFAPTGSGIPAPVGETLQLSYYGDYVFPARKSALYPVWDAEVFKRLGLSKPDYAASTTLEPYMATAAASCSCADTTCMRALLTGAGARKIYLEVPSDPRIHSYARYVVDSEQYPISTHFAEFLVRPEGEATATRVVWWSNEAGENMRRECWKVMETLFPAGE